MSTPTYTPYCTVQVPISADAPVSSPGDSRGLAAGVLAVAATAAVCVLSTTGSSNAQSMWVATQQQGLVQAPAAVLNRPYAQNPHIASNPRAPARYATAPGSERYTAGDEYLAGTASAPSQISQLASTIWAPLALVAAGLVAWAWRHSAAQTRPAAICPEVMHMAALAPKKRAALSEDPYGDEVRQGFMDWLVENGLPEQNVTLKYVGPAGWGLVANRAISRGEISCKVPDSVLITKDRVLKELDPKLVAFITDSKLPDYWVLAIFLVEMFAATNSKDDCKFAPYILSLPRETGSVLEWGRSAITDLLKGSPIESTAYEMNNDVNEAITWLAKEMPKSNTTKYAKFYTRENLRWAFAILFSRVVRLISKEGTLALIPWADMLNHSPTVQRYLDWEENENAVCFRADRSYKPGEEVFVSYGPRSSGDLLLTYGFVPRNRKLQAQNEKVDLVLSLDSKDPMAGPKTQALIKYDLTTPRTFPLQLNTFPEGLVEYAAFIVSEPETVEEVEALAEQAFGKGKLSEELDLKGRQHVKKVCYSVLQRYKGSADQDKKIIEPKLQTQIAASDFMAQDSRAAAAAVVRLRERAILKKTGDSIEFPADWLTNVLNTNPADIFKNPFR